MKLRPYQQEAITAIEAGWKDYQRQLLVLPTGTGKTIVFSTIAANEAARGNRVLILAHYDELLQQAQDKIWNAVGLYTALEKGSKRADAALMPVVVGSRQSMHKRRLENRWPEDGFDLIIIDEAHHALSDSYKTILRHFNEARVLGVTATPDRGDRKSLAEVFENIAYDYGLRKAVGDGFLCPIRAEMINLEIDLSKVRTAAGDYRADDADEALMPYLDAAAEQLATMAKSRKILAFLPLIRTSKAFAESCRRVGIHARHIDGTSEDRKELLSTFAAGGFQMLTNASLLLEGYDCPDIDCVVVLRPTKSRALYCQMVGRGTRVAPGKVDLLLPDFLWQTKRHDLCVPASLLAKTQKEAEAMTQYIVAKGSGELLEVEKDVQAETERKLAEELAKKAKCKSQAVDPLEWAVTIHASDLQDYEPVMPWEAAPPSAKQVALIEKFGLNTDMIQCAGQASQVISKLMNRRAAGLCTVKQARLLKRNGIDPTNVSFAEASSLIDGLARSWGK